MQYPAKQSKLGPTIMAADPRALSKSRWANIFKQALDADGWGQAIEAADFYSELGSLIERQVRFFCVVVSFPSSRCPLCATAR